MSNKISNNTATFEEPITSSPQFEFQEKISRLNPVHLESFTKTTLSKVDTISNNTQNKLRSFNTSNPFIKNKKEETHP